MAWNGFQGQSGRANQGYVEEGNVKCFVFSDTPTRVRFLTEDISPEDIMSQLKITREEAEDHIYTKMSKDRWIFPKSYWEHSIPSIPNKRFYSSVHCEGKSRCELCAENDVAKENGVTENKLLPFPVRKRFIVPAYVYDLKMVLYVRGSEDFFDGVAAYVNKNGSNIDFDIYKKGKGFNTTYHSVFDGPSEDLPVDLVVLSPSELSLSISHEEIKRRVDGTPANHTTNQNVREYHEQHAAPQAAAQQPKEEEVKVEKQAEPVEIQKQFTIPFGQHKGKTFDDLMKSGNSEYIKFLAENSNGEVQRAAKEFMGVQ